MALAHFQRTFTDASGNIKPGLSVTVRRESDNGLAALFADAGSVTPKSNPFNTDANGYGSFYVTDGRYRIQATDIDWRDTDIFISPTFYAQLAGGPLANFTTMPQVGGDPIVESGSNADGEWTRWADGTQVARGTFSAVSIADGGFNVYSWDFPASFSVAPVTMASATEDYGISLTDVSATVRNSTSTSGNQSAIRNTAGRSVSVGLNAYAVGNWK